MKNYIMIFLTGIPFGIIFFFLIWFRSGLAAGLIVGAIIAAVIGIAGTAFYHSQKVEFRKSSPLHTGGQNIVMDGPCNHFVGKEGVGGWMYLTEREIIFVSHNINYNVHSLNILLDSITDISFYNALGFVPNGMSVTTQAGKVEKFVLYDRKKWARAIQKGA